MDFMAIDRLMDIDMSMMVGVDADEGDGVHLSIPVAESRSIAVSNNGSGHMVHAVLGWNVSLQTKKVLAREIVGILRQRQGGTRTKPTSL